uniref:Uncharacterized protein n=1 Tax=Daphnia galeata TaxID=27404 RepID=A0A8J2RIP2_9CRUS|nr:unnamed protein product [Daphnia galeata]
MKLKVLYDKKTTFQIHFELTLNPEQGKTVRDRQAELRLSSRVKETCSSFKMYAFGRKTDEARAELETLRKRVEEGLSNKLPQEVPVPAPPTKLSRGINASWHNKRKSTYYSDPKISEEEFERRKHLPEGIQHHIVTTRTKPNKEVEVLETPTIITTPLFVDLDDELPSPSPNEKSIPDLKDSTSDFVESELDAQLSAASRPSVAPTPDPVHVSQPLLISPPDPVHQLAESTIKGVTASTSTISDYGLRVQKLVDLQSEEQRGRDRIAVIDRTMEELHSERKALTDKVLSLKQEQYELLLSTTPNHPFESVNASRYSEQTTTTTNKNPAATESAQPMEESSPVHPIPHANSTDLLYLMHQSEEKGVQIALTDAEVVSSLPNSHKRVHSVEENIPNKKMDYKASPDKLEKGSTNVAVFQPMHSNSTISSVISQSVESSCPNDQIKEISTGKAQTVYEPTVPQPKVAELKVAEQMVQIKVVKSKVVQPKVVQTKKSSTAAKASKTTQKPTDANSRSLENCRTSSLREKSSTQNNYRTI